MSAIMRADVPHRNNWGFIKLAAVNVWLLARRHIWNWPVWGWGGLNTWAYVAVFPLSRRLLFYGDPPGFQIGLYNRAGESTDGGDPGAHAGCKNEPDCKYAGTARRTTRGYG